eukprot:CAMPEP_0113632462 /NCGR_PEP_ID=MMETSP0017_2-20120614/16874_1 /TAXON_ID=2856 /ORGANISM="Cylindrotheca closterium" /LENGTH=894 /DNA_ID=CAMNT_0000543021 /DNA_START=9 /DNA_END=2693 /DNA_ORIENTATION=+ /assembly_acc=CAM_ASM_000147
MTSLEDLNIVVAPVQARLQPIKKNRNNKYERRRRKAKLAKEGNVSTTTTTTPATTASPAPTVKKAEPQNDKTPDNQSTNAIPVQEKTASAETTPKNTETEKKVEVDSSPEEPKAVKEEISKHSTKRDKSSRKKQDSPEISNDKITPEEPSVPVKVSRRNRPKAKEGVEESEEDHAKYLAEYHARPMELDRRSGARAVTRVSKESSHIFVAQEWDSLDINARMTQALKSRFELNKPTGIQAKTIQTFQDNPKKNVLVHSETGSGKTLAYLLPILQSLGYGEFSKTGDAKKKARKELGTKCLILCPTRELASQTLQVLEKLCQANFAGWIVPGGLLGGDSRNSEKSRIRKGLAIVVATPGRLLDHLQKTQSLLLNLKGKLQWLVLDEADRLLDMGLGDQVRQIVQIVRSNEASKSKTWLRSVLVSATVTQSVQALANERILCGDQKWVWVKGAKSKPNQDGGSKGDNDHTDNATTKGDSEDGYSASTPRQLEQFHITVTAKLRLSTLVAFLVQRIKKGERVVVFMGTCASVDYHCQLFESSESLWESDSDTDSKGLFGSKAKVFKLHGSVAHSRRNQTLKNFNAVKSSAILLSTDVSARGLNLKGVDWTVQYDPPCEISDYVHRVGRVARAGKAGHSLLFLLPSERAYLDVLKTKGINELTPLSLSNTLNQAASACKSLSIEGMKNGGGGSNFGKEKPSSRLGEYFALEIQRRFEDCVIKDDIEAKKEKKEKDKKRKRKKESSKKKEGLLMELARDAFMGFLRAYSTKKEAAVRSIFSARALHVGHVARSFALKEPPKSLVSKHRQSKKDQEQENMDAEANKPKALAFNSANGATRDDEEGVIPESYDKAVKEIEETRVFKRPRFGGDKDAGRAKNAKALLLANAFNMQNNLMDAM